MEAVEFAQESIFLFLRTFVLATGVYFFILLGSWPFHGLAEFLRWFRGGTTKAVTGEGMRE